jgi:hypothetical protein
MTKGGSTMKHIEKSEEKKEDPNVEHSFDIVDDKREQYLLLIVHGIGTSQEW